MLAVRVRVFYSVSLICTPFVKDAQKHPCLFVRRRFQVTSRSTASQGNNGLSISAVFETGLLIDQPSYKLMSYSGSAV